MKQVAGRQRTAERAASARSHAACALGAAANVPQRLRRAEAQPRRERIELVVPSCAGRSAGSVPWRRARHATRQSSIYCCAFDTSPPSRRLAAQRDRAQKDVLVGARSCLCARAQVLGAITPATRRTADSRGF